MATFNIQKISSRLAAVDSAVRFSAVFPRPGEDEIVKNNLDILKRFFTALELNQEAVENVLNGYNNDWFTK